MIQKILQPIKESTEDYEAIEDKIRECLKRELYLPLIQILDAPREVLTNSKSYLTDAIRFGRVQFYRGTFTGRFNARISKELKALGARWDRQTGTWKLSQSSLPMDVRNAIHASAAHFERKIQQIDLKLSGISTGEITENLKLERHFDRALWKVDREFARSVKNLTVAPQLTKEERRKIAADWTNNMKLYIKDWTKKEIVSLRKDMQASVFAGNRYETAVKTIQKSYDVAQGKAKFLARQETGLLMAKFKEVKYKSAGVKRFIWKTVTGTASHPVRPAHKICDGKIFSWDNPNELDMNGVPKAGGVQKPAGGKNPGEDYNCRCYAKPIVDFGGK